MITLEYGHIQGANGLPIVPNGYIEMYLNTDATIIASPYGQVLGGTINAVQFYFDSNCNLIGTPMVWSNLELDPQNYMGLGTWYVVNFYDENGTRLNNQPQQWVFTQAEGSTVDISSMVAVNGSRIYYPIPFFLYPVPANYVLIGPVSGEPAIPTFRPITTSDIGFVDDEVPTGTINGTNATFTLSQAPNPPASLNLYVNGVRYTEGVAFTLSSSTIAYETDYIPQDGDSHICDYRT